MFNRRKPAHLYVDAAGLAKLIKDLYEHSSITAMVDGFYIQVKPVISDPNRQIFRVQLERWQEKALLTEIPQTSLQALYSPEKA